MSVMLEEYNAIFDLMPTHMLSYTHTTYDSYKTVCTNKNQREVSFFCE